MKTSEALQQAQELVRKGWCRGSYAKLGTKSVENPGVEPADKYCATGACLAVTKEDVTNNTPATQDLWFYLDIAAQAKGGIGAIAFNDAKKNKRDVLRLFDNAIELAKQDGV